VRSLPGRPAFEDALVWLAVLGDVPEVVAKWNELRSQRGRGAAGEAAELPAGGRPRRRRRRRRRRPATEP
jgi:hypothetical protein